MTVVHPPKPLPCSPRSHRDCGGVGCVRKGHGLGVPIGFDSTAYAGRAHAWCARCIAMGDAPSIVEGSMCVSHEGCIMHSSVSCSTGAPHRVQGGPGYMGIVTTMPMRGSSLPPERGPVHSARIRVNRHGSLACHGADPHQR